MRNEYTRPATTKIYQESEITSVTAKRTYPIKKIYIQKQTHKRPVGRILVRNRIVFKHSMKSYNALIIFVISFQVNIIDSEI